MTTDIFTPQDPNIMRTTEVLSLQESVVLSTPPLAVRANYGGLKYTASWWEWHRAQRAYDGGSR